MKSELEFGWRKRVKVRRMPDLYAYYQFILNSSLGNLKAHFMPAIMDERGQQVTVL